MRVALLNEGTYPVLHGGVSTWCDQLVRALPEHVFSIVTLTGQQEAAVWDLPTNVRSFDAVPLWGQTRRRWMMNALRERREQGEVAGAYADLWAAVLPSRRGVPGDAFDVEADLEGAEIALRALARERTQSLMALFSGGAGTRGLMRAWESHVEGTALPALTGADAAEVSRHVDRMLAVMDAPWPKVDLAHVTTNGPAALMALGRHWRDGTPVLMTEHGVYLRERYLALRAAKLAWPVRYALMAMTRVICRLAYLRCSLITPVSEFNARWERRLGAPDSAVVTIPNGVDARMFSPIADEPQDPTVSFVGRIDPLKDLQTLVEAFAVAREHVSNARLRLFGPVPAGNEAYAERIRQLVASLGLDDAVTFEGAVPNARPAIEAGHVVALSSISEGLPYTVIESMMCGRVTVSTDVGGVNECVGRDEVSGLLVPPRDPAAMGAAFARLLNDEQERKRMGEAARVRALATFCVTSFGTRYRAVYAAVAGGIDDEVMPTLRRALATCADDDLASLAHLNAARALAQQPGAA